VHRHLSPPPFHGVEQLGTNPDPPGHLHLRELERAHPLFPQRDTLAIAIGDFALHDAVASAEIAGLHGRAAAQFLAAGLFRSAHDDDVRSAILALGGTFQFGWFPSLFYSFVIKKGPARADLPGLGQICWSAG
jgi:hypothetical protein